MKVDSETYRATDTDGHDVFWWGRRCKNQDLVRFLSDYAEKKGLTVDLSPIPGEENAHRYEEDACWCDVCTRNTIHDTPSYSCETCDGQFLICGECYGAGKSCRDSSHAIGRYTCDSNRTGTSEAGASET